MNSKYGDRFIRNLGIFTGAEQEQLRKATVAVAGVGGVGGLLVERLVRLGIGNIKLTDPGTFELSNTNRQYGCSAGTNERYKAEVVYEAVQAINPEAHIIFDTNGITNIQDAKELVNGSDLVLDEMDYGAWKESIYLQRAARRRGIYYSFAGALGFGALLTNFAPDGVTLEEYNGMPADEDLDQIDVINVGVEKVLPVTPSYITSAMTMETLQEIITGIKPVPTCSIGVGLASIMAASAAVSILLQRQDVVRAPRYTYLDLFDQQFMIGSITKNGTY